MGAGGGGGGEGERVEARPRIPPEKDRTVKTVDRHQNNGSGVPSQLRSN